MLKKILTVLVLEKVDRLLKESFGAWASGCTW
jgi:hypothetical protein